MGELEPLLDGFDICRGVFRRERWIGIQVEVWRKHWLAACRDHGGRESVRFTRHSVEVNMIPRTLSTHALEEGLSSRRAQSILLRVRWLRSLIALPSG